MCCVIGPFLSSMRDAYIFPRRQIETRGRVEAWRSIRTDDRRARGRAPTTGTPCSRSCRGSWRSGRRRWREARGMTETDLMVSARRSRSAGRRPGDLRRRARRSVIGFVHLHSRSTTIAGARTATSPTSSSRRAPRGSGSRPRLLAEAEAVDAPPGLRLAVDLGLRRERACRRAVRAPRVRAATRSSADQTARA